MYRTLSAITLIIFSLAAHGALRFEGTSLQPVAIDVTASTGLAGVYVVNTTSGLSLIYTASSAASAVDVATFGITGATSTEPVDPTTISRNGTELTITGIQGNSGYAFTESGRTTYYWIADYSAAPYTISAIYPASEQDCDRTFLQTDGSAPAMYYHGINGRSYEIDRQITLEYTTLVGDADNTTFNSSEQSINFTSINGTFSIDAPLCDTYFTLSGDRFLRAWGMENEVSSSRFTATSVRAVTSASQKVRESLNEIKTETANLGGSAPVEIHFEAAVSDAAIFTQWQMARDEDFEDITFRIADLDFTYTFTEMGTVYVRFMCADATGQCEYFGDTYTVSIGESRLLCPNAFSPGASEGVNDEWKVSYKSIVDFECYIFNRWGEKMAEFHNPDQGWDGKYGGKLVPAGVYYYVIKAKGSDGKKYNLSGDINIVRYSN